MGDVEATDGAGNGREGAILCMSMENVYVGLRSTDLRALRTNGFWRWISWAWGQWFQNRPRACNVGWESFRLGILLSKEWKMVWWEGLQFRGHKDRDGKKYRSSRSKKNLRGWYGDGFMMILSMSKTQQLAQVSSKLSELPYLLPILCAGLNHFKPFRVWTLNPPFFPSEIDLST